MFSQIAICLKYTGLNMWINTNYFSQLYKFTLATRLADVGLLQKSLQYLERLAVRMIYNPAGAPAGLMDSVCTLADRLKFYDPVGDIEDESLLGDALESSRSDHSWLKDLRAVLNDHQVHLLNGVYLNPMF